MWSGRVSVLCLIVRRPPRSTRPDTLVPYPTHFRSDLVEVRVVVAGLGVQGHEQGDGEGAHVVGQGDAHVASARPDVQRVGLDAEAAVAGRRDFELLVAMAEPPGALHPDAPLAHLRLQRGARAGAPA